MTTTAQNLRPATALSVRVPDPEERRRQQALWTTDSWQVGRFEARPETSLFQEASSPGHLAIVFPRRAVGLERGGSDALLADSTKILLHNRWSTYRRRVVDPMGDECFWYWVDDGVLEEVGAAELVHRRGRQLEFSQSELPCDLELFRLERWIAASVGADGDRLLLEESLWAMLDALVRAVGGQRVGGDALRRADRLALDAVDEFLAAHFAEAPSLDRIAAVAGCSKYHLARLYRRHRGRTLHARRSELQLRAAYDLVTEGEHSLTEIAMDLGFSSSSHFSSRFRQWFGVAPSALGRAVEVH